MRRRQWALFGVLVAAALFLGSALNGGVGSVGKTMRAPDPSVAKVMRVTDDVDVRLRFVSGAARNVRLIGVDASEFCFRGRARSFAVRFLPPGARVRVVFDNRRRDADGTLLAYIYRVRDKAMLNAELLRTGAATIYTVPPNVAHVREFLALRRVARDTGRGAWARCEAS